MLIQKYCVRSLIDLSDARCLQCKQTLYYRRKRLCAMYQGMEKRWPEIYDFLRSEIDRLTAENEELKQILAFVRRRASRRNLRSRQ
jgi:hypothetical protein